MQETFEQMLGNTVPNVLLALDFGCEGCNFMLGQNDTVTISMYRVAEDTVVGISILSCHAQRPA
jgi:hypothetical protein